MILYNKTIWNSGDIITQDKWDNINNNLSIIVGAYQLPFTFENNYMTIHKSYKEIISLLKQGIICYYLYENTIFYIQEYNDYGIIYNNNHDYAFYPSLDNTTMIYYQAPQ